MRLFLKKISIAIGILFTSFLAFFIFVITVCAPQYTKTYNAAIIDKVERLESINVPKIILVGNSNVAFGFDSKQIEAEINMPVVNLGLHGGLNNTIHENMAKFNINNGDIVVISHTSYEDDGHISDYNLAWITIDNHYHLWKVIDFQEWPKMLHAFPKYVVNTLYMWINGKGDEDTGAYNRYAFDEYGDNIYPRNELTYEWSYNSVNLLKINDTCVNRLNAFSEYCKERGATLVVAGYPIGDGEYTPNHELFVNDWNELKSKLTFPVISDIEDYFIPYDCFYDSEFHLNENGVAIRTKQFITDLKNWMND